VGVDVGLCVGVGVRLGIGVGVGLSGAGVGVVIGEITEPFREGFAILKIKAPPAAATITIKMITAIASILVIALLDVRRHKTFMVFLNTFNLEVYFKKPCLACGPYNIKICSSQLPLTNIINFKDFPRNRIIITISLQTTTTNSNQNTQFTMIIMILMVGRTGFEPVIFAA
jgi:hypothetical protein